MSLSDDASNRLNVALGSISAGAEIAFALGAGAWSISDDARNRVRAALGNSAGEDFLANLLAVTAITCEDTLRRLGVALGSQLAAIEFAALVNVVTPPRIFQDLPSAATVNEGATIRLNAFASSGPTGAAGDLTSQWQVSTDRGGTWSDLSTDANYEITPEDGPNHLSSALIILGPPVAYNGYRYRKIWTNNIGTATSVTCALGVIGLFVTQPPLFTTTDLSGNATISCVFYPTAPPMLFPWPLWLRSADGGDTWVGAAGMDGGIYQDSFQPFPRVGPLTATLTITGAVSAEDNYQYLCEALFSPVVLSGPLQPSGPLGYSRSRPSILTVLIAVSFTGPPSTRTTDGNGDATISVTAAGNPAPTLQWQYSTDSGATWTNATGGIYAGDTSDTLIVTGASVGGTGDGYWYRCAGHNAAGTVNSGHSVLTVYATPTISEQPTAQDDTGSGATFSLTATGTPPELTYQWSRSTDGIGYVAITAINASTLDAGVTYSGYDTDSLFESGASSTQNGFYYGCVVTNTAGSVISNAVQLTVTGGGGTQTFNSSGSWTAPAGVTAVKVQAIGAGGGGGGGTPFAGGGGAGGGGYTEHTAYTVVPGNPYAVQVGAGGTLGANFGGDGGDGGGSGFDSTVIALGGSKGGGATMAAGMPGSGGAGAGGTSSNTGGAGAVGGGGGAADNAGNGNAASGNTGGSAGSGTPAGGKGGTGGASPTAGSGPGGGGGAGGTGVAGAAGADGQVVLTWS